MAPPARVAGKLHAPPQSAKAPAKFAEVIRLRDSLIT